MTTNTQSPKPKRTVVAPQPVTTSQLPPNRVLSVELDEGGGRLEMVCAPKWRTVRQRILHCEAIARCRPTE